MGVRIRLNDGINLVARVDLDAFTKAYEVALKNGEPLEVENGSGRMRRLNPLQILYFENAESLDEPDQDPSSLPSSEGQTVP